MTYAALVLLAACIVLGFCLYLTLAGTAEQIRDLLTEREELLTEIRRLRMGRHPARRALREDGPPPLSPFAKIGDLRPLNPPPAEPVEEA